MLDDKLIQEVVDYLDGQLDEPAQRELRKKLDRLGYDLNELSDLQYLQNKLKRLPVAQLRESMSDSFYKQLDSYNRFNLKIWWHSLEIRRRAPQLAYAALLLICGWIAGYWMSSERSSSDELSLLTAEVRQMKQMVSLTLIQHPSPVERLKAVNKLSMEPQSGPTVVDALLYTLNTDPNNNVRLAAIDALSSFIEQPHVRQGLIQSFSAQKSPIVQLTLADLMAAAGEKAARQPIEMLLLRNDLNIFLRRGLERNLNKLI